MRTKTYFIQKSASTTLRCFTGYHFNAHKSRHCSGSIPFDSFAEKTNTGTVMSMEVLENIAFEHIWPRTGFLGRSFRTNFPTSRRSAALMTVVCTVQTPSNNQNATERLQDRWLPNACTYYHDQGLASCLTRQVCTGYLQDTYGCLQAF